MANKRVLHIVRHAKSSWDYENISDLDRPLKLRGIRDAYDMSRRLKINQKIPQRLICSPANRALHTATIFIRVFEIEYNLLSVDPRLYGQGFKSIVQVIEGQDDSVEELMIFGHNPDFSDLAEYYTKNNYIDMPTCGVVSIEFTTDLWKKVSPNNSQLEKVDYPKNELSV